METVSVAQMLDDVRTRIRNLSPAEVADDLANRDVVLVDLRERSEIEDRGFIDGSVPLPRGLLEFLADPDSPHRHEELAPARRTILYCASGARSALAVETLQTLGYQDVAHLDGGLTAWREQGFAVESVGHGSSNDGDERT